MDLVHEYWQKAIELILVAFALAVTSVASAQSCTSVSGYPLGAWSLTSTLNGGPCSSCANEWDFLTPTSGIVFLNGTAVDTFTSSPVQAGAGFSATAQSPGYVVTSNGIVSADGCKISVEWGDNLGQRGTSDFTYGGGGGSPPLQITTTSLPSGTPNSPYPPTTLMATGGTPPYTWSVSGLPSGLSVNSTTGVISGTPTQAEISAPVTVSVNDSVGGNFSVQLSITIGCGDDRDKIIQEYITYNVPFYPGTTPEASAPHCSDFTQTAHTGFYQFSDLNTGQYSDWAIIRQPLVNPSSVGGLDNWIIQQGGAPVRPINYAYRNPALQFSLPHGTARRSRHMFGDAVDLRNLSFSLIEYNFLAKRAWAAGASWVEPNKPPYTCRPAVQPCVHADWRNAPGGFINP